jgi:DNA mismatch endonuclease (patch repair protein)
MADTITPERRSWNMSRIRSRNTKPELLLRSLLHRAGYRFRIHRRDLAGSPDIVLPKYSTAILVHGCFWHRHPGCKKATTPSTRTDFWEAKFNATVERDKMSSVRLKCAGWHVITVWECELELDARRVLSSIECLLSDAFEQKHFIRRGQDESR